MSTHIQLLRMRKNLEDWGCGANVPIISATQTTRSGYGVLMLNLLILLNPLVSCHVADLMFALISLRNWRSWDRYW